MLKKYQQAFLIGFHNSLTYRVNFFLSLASTIFPLLMQAFLWRAIYQNLPVSQTQVYGYTYSGMLSYVLTASILAKLTDTSIKWDIHTDIKEGGLSKYIVKPIGYLRFRVAQSFGQKLMPLIIILILLFTMLTLLSSLLQLTLTITHILLFFITLFLALVLSLGITFIISSFAFWLTEAWALYIVLDVTVLLTSGGVFPLEVYGSTVNQILSYLPFQYIIYFPTNVLKGTLDTSQITQGMVMQLLWIVVIYTVNHLVWKIGLRKYVAVGG